MPGSGKTRINLCVLIFVAIAKHSAQGMWFLQAATSISHNTSISAFDLSSGLGINLGNPSANLSKT